MLSTNTPSAESFQAPGFSVSRAPHRDPAAAICDALQPRHPNRMRPRGAPPIGFWQTREGRCLRHRELDGHAKLGAAGQPSVAVREPSRNQRPTKFPSLQSAGAALSVNVLNKRAAKPKQLKKNLSSRSPHGPFGYFVTFPPDRTTPTNELKPAETGAVFRVL